MKRKLTFPNSKWGYRETGMPLGYPGALLYLVAHANHGDNEPQEGLERGEVQASRKQLRRDWGWNDYQVRKFLDTLEENGTIERYKPNGPRSTSVIRLINYDRHQFSSPRISTRKPTRISTSRTQEEQGETEEKRQGFRQGNRQGNRQRLSNNVKKEKDQVILSGRENGENPPSEQPSFFGEDAHTGDDRDWDAVIRTCHDAFCGAVDYMGGRGGAVKLTGVRKRGWRELIEEHEVIESINDVKLMAIGSLAYWVEDQGKSSGSAYNSIFRNDGQNAQNYITQGREYLIDNRADTQDQERSRDVLK